MSLGERRAMIVPSPPRLLVVRQCALVGLNRSGVYHRPQGESAATLALMRLIDEVFLEHPFYGARQMVLHLRRLGHRLGRHRVRRLMGKMGRAPIYQRPRTSLPHPQHPVYPYLLRDMLITRPNQVWCADITYIPMRRGFLYLVAIMDWAEQPKVPPAIADGMAAEGTRRVLAWRLSNTMEADFCIEALSEALTKFGSPEIFNTDQGSQFTSPRFTGLLSASGVRVSMDGRGRWMDNVFIERLWRSLKYECVYIHAFETGSALRAGLTRWIAFYNAVRPHTALDGRTPDKAYYELEISALPGLAPARLNNKLAA